MAKKSKHRKKQKVANKNINILMHLVCIEKIDEYFEQRYKDFIRDFRVALTYKDKKEGSYKLQRLSDELNGYIARIDHEVRIADREYKNKYENRYRSLEDIGKGLEENGCESELKKIKGNLNKFRNFSCHPFPSYVAFDFLNSEKDVEKVIKNSVKKLRKLSSTNELDCKREENKQMSTFISNVEKINDVNERDLKDRWS